MKKLIIMSGIPGSGKSTYAHKLAEKHNMVVVSYDDIREELFGDPSCFYDREFAEREMRKKHIQQHGTPEQRRMQRHRFCDKYVRDVLSYRVRQSLKLGRDVIIDATNVTPTARKRLMNKFCGLYTSVESIWVRVPLGVALERCRRRNKNVPDRVVFAMNNRFIAPNQREGFDRLTVINS